MKLIYDKLKVVVVYSITTALAIFVVVFLLQAPESMRLNMVKTDIGTPHDDNLSVNIDQSGDDMLIYGMTNLSMFAPYQGATDAYIYKISSAGTRLWGYQFGTQGRDKLTGAKSCPNGDVIVAGTTTGDLVGMYRGRQISQTGMTGTTKGDRFGTKPKQQAGFIARISSSGKFIWAQPITGIGVTDIYISDIGNNRILLEVGSYDDSTSRTRLQVLDMSGELLVDKLMPDESYPEFIYRVGSRYHYRIDGKAVTFGPDLKQLNAFEIDWNHTSRSDIVRLDGADCFIGTVGMSSIVLTLLADGKVKAELPVATPELSYDHENTLIEAGNNGAKIWFVIMTQATSDGTTSDEINRDLAKCSAALYETDGNKTVKLFDIYTPPASRDSLRQVVTRPDGSYACIYELWRWLHSSTLMDIYAPNGSRLGHYVLPATVEWTWASKGASVIVGKQEFTHKNMRVEVVAPLPVVASPVITLSSEKPSDGPEYTMTCDTRGAVIRYTTDGSEPTLKSQKYSRPISVDSDTNVKARAFKRGMLPSLRTYQY